MGVNLEGMAYSGWPIARFILAELEYPSIEQLKTKLECPEQIFVRFARDAWQVQSRLKIEERNLGGVEKPISVMDTDRWISTLTEALSCLNGKKEYRGRGQQKVTLVNQPKKGGKIRTMWVSPHLTIWSPIEKHNDWEHGLRAGISRLEPVHEWVSRLSQ